MFWGKSKSNTKSVGHSRKAGARGREKRAGRIFRKRNLTAGSFYIPAADASGMSQDDGSFLDLLFTCQRSRNRREQFVNCQLHGSIHLGHDSRHISMRDFSNFENVIAPHGCAR